MVASSGAVAQATKVKIAKNDENTTAYVEGNNMASHVNK